MRIVCGKHIELCTCVIGGGKRSLCVLNGVWGRRAWRSVLKRRRCRTAGHFVGTSGPKTNQSMNCQTSESAVSFAWSTSSLDPLRTFEAGLFQVLSLLLKPPLVLVPSFRLKTCTQLFYSLKRLELGSAKQHVEPVVIIQRVVRSQRREIVHIPFYSRDDIAGTRGIGPHCVSDSWMRQGVGIHRRRFKGVDIPFWPVVQH